MFYSSVVTYMFGQYVAFSRYTQFHDTVTLDKLWVTVSQNT